MNDPVLLQQEIDRLKESVRTLTTRVSQLETQSIKTAPLMTAPSAPLVSSPIKPAVSATAKPHRKNVAAGLQWTIGIIGFLLLYGGALSLVIPILGLIFIALAIFWPWKMPAPTTVATTGSSPAAVHTAPQKRQPSVFEQDLAKHWYSWLGIISIVVGITLLLNYALSSYGVTGRIITAYAAAVMLFGLAAWFHRKYYAFAMVLQSGAWATAYVATYALHGATGGPVTDPMLGGLLIEAVVVAMIAAAMIQNSRAMTMGAFLLGFLAAAVGGVTIFTLGANALLIIGLVLVAIYRRWTFLVIPGTVIAYIVHAAWALNNWSDLKNLAPQSVGFLIVYVLVFGLAHWLETAADERQKQLAVIAAVVNLGGFYVLFDTTLRVAGSEQQWMGTIFLALVVGILAMIAHRVPSRSHLRAPYMLLAIGFITLGLAQKFSGSTLVLSWIVESAVLLGLGLAANIRSTRIAAYIVTLLTAITLLPTLGLTDHFGTTSISAAWVNGLLMIIVLAVMSFYYRSRLTVISADEKKVHHVLFDTGALLALVLTVGQLDAAWVMTVWAALGAALYMLGLPRRDANMRVVGAVILILSIFGLWMTVLPETDMAGMIKIHSRILVGAWVAAGLALAAAYGRKRVSLVLPGEDKIWMMLAWATIFVVTITLGYEITNRLLSVAWGVEGVLLYLAGFTLQSRLARNMGLAVMALTIAKVYLLDVTNLDKPYQILSFIVLGIILLGIGFLYNRWRQQSRPTPPTS